MSHGIRGSGPAGGDAIDRRPAAVLFDMDGTLVDTEKVWQRGLVELAARHGAMLPSPALARMLGATTPEAMTILYAEIGQPGRDHDAGARWLDAYVMADFASGVPWRPGARALLAAVHAARLPTALVTATARAITEVILDTLGRDNFDAVITDDDVRHGKPHPEPYLAAAGALGVAPERCVAIEDSATGCASALAAGCVVLGVPGEAELPPFDGIRMVASLVDVDVALLCGLIAATAAPA